MTTVDPSGFPAKYRGLYFDGAARGFIPLPSFTLYHTCSFHFWTKIHAGGSIFSKDRNAFGSDAERHILIKFDSDRRPRFKLANDDDVST